MAENKKVVFLIGRHEITNEQIKKALNLGENVEIKSIANVGEKEINEIVETLRNNRDTIIVGVIPSNIMVEITRKAGRPVEFYNVVVNKDLYKRLTNEEFDSKNNKLDQLLPSHPELLNISKNVVSPQSYITEDIERLREFKYVRFPKNINVIYEGLIRYLGLENSENSDVCLSVPDKKCRVAIFVNVRDRNKRYSSVDEVLNGIRNKEFVYSVVYYE